MTHEPELTSPGGRHRDPRGKVWRTALYLLGGTAGVLISLAIGASAASASPHVQKTVRTPASGYTLCAASSGAVTFTASTCPTGTTDLAVGQQSEIATLQSKVSTLQSQVSTLQSQVSTLQAQVSTLATEHTTDAASITTLQKLLTGVTRSTVDGRVALRVSGENLQVVNGTGNEDTANGLGNLIVGYDGSPGTQTGSHNLVLGTGQSDTSYGALLAGQHNAANRPFTSVSGEYNVANDPSSALAGGCDDLTGPGSVPAGPCPSSGYEAISAGASNHASGVGSSIQGGQSNSASGPLTVISSGLGNAADGTESWVGGGYANTSGSNESTITGGGENTATGEVSTITGGYYNTATVDEAVVVGGCSNLAGAGNPSIDPSCTLFQNAFPTVLGGIGNQAITYGSTVSGGQGNVVSGGSADSISGGEDETLSGLSSYLTRSGNSLFNP